MLIPLLWTLTALAPMQEVQSPPNSKTSTVHDSLLDDLEIMSRVIQRRIAENHDKIQGNDDPYASRPRRRSTVSETYSSMLLGSRGSSSDTRADYIPGHGAVFTLGVALPIVLRGRTDNAKPEEKETLSETARVWHETQQALEGRPGHRRGPQRDVTWEAVETTFYRESLDTLGDVLSEVLLDFGDRLPLRSGETISISVRLLPAHSGRSSFDISGLSRIDGINQRLGPNRDQPTDPVFSGPRRLIVQLDVDSLMDMKSGHIDREGLKAQARIREL